jgi:energy-converting hydrogenase Eha subunit A
MYQALIIGLYPLQKRKYNRSQHSPSAITHFPRPIGSVMSPQTFAQKLVAHTIGVGGISDYTL